MRKLATSWRLLLLFFALLYIGISLVNHWCFRTYALDLGVYTAALYDYAHFSFNDSTSFKPVAENLLADHFDLYLVLLSPLSWIFGAYTLLLAQMAAILFGGRGVYRLMQVYGERTAILAALYFFMYFGIIAAVSFDYHSNVVAACFVPWLFMAIREQNLGKFLLYFLLILVSRENLSLLLFVLLPCTLAVYKGLAPSFKKWIWIAAAFSLAYFVLISAFVMPGLSNTGKMYQFRYSVLGQDYGEALKNLVTHPVDTFNNLFRNHSGNTKFDFIKAELWIYLGLSGGVLFLMNWPFLVMLLPVLAQKLFHDQPEMWGINDHYSAELAPVMTIGVFYTIHRLHAGMRVKKVLQYALPVLSLALTVHMMDNPRSLVRRDNIRIYKTQHYRPVIDRQEFREFSKLVPNDAALSCQSLLQPHFAWRDKIYAYPIVNDAQFVLLYTKGDYYPLTTAQYVEKAAALRNDWITVKEDTAAGLLLLRKK